MMASERRKRRRFNLRRTVYIGTSNEAGFIRCRTKNLSSSGFYCVSKKSFTPGEYLQCTVMFRGRRNARAGFVLKSVIQVLRVESIESGESFGLACRIRNYSVVRLAAGARDGGFCATSTLSHHSGAKQ
jgi:hypothetical protein